MPKDQPFSYQDKQLLQEVSHAVQWIDVGGRNHEEGLEKLIRQITEICENTATKSFLATDGKKEYLAVLEINHNTKPAEVRFYIQEKLKIKLGQIFEAIKKRTKTEILILTKEGYRQATPEELDKYRERKSNHDKHIAEFTHSSFGNILKFLQRFRGTMPSES